MSIARPASPPPPPPPPPPAAEAEAAAEPACEKGHAAPLLHVLVAQKWHAVAAADAGGAEAGAGPADAADAALLARCSKRHSSPFAQWPAAK